MENQLAPVNLVFLHIALLKSWNLVLIAREKLEGYRGTWHECYYKLRGNNESDSNLLSSSI